MGWSASVCRLGQFTALASLSYCSTKAKPMLCSSGALIRLRMSWAFLNTVNILLGKEYLSTPS